jgi:hypothetical protein
MPKESSPGNGAVFKNTYKTEDKHPDLKGDARLPDGTKVKLALWKKEDKNGSPYFSIKIEFETERKSGPAAIAAESRRRDVPFDDDFPF